MSESWPLLMAALLMGLMGGVHCASMCGGLAAVMCSSKIGGSRWISMTNLGRIGSYGLLGILAGSAGGLLGAAFPVAAVQVVARVLAASTLLLVGLYLAGFGKSWAGSGKRLGEGVRVLARWVATRGPGGAPGAVLRGAVWGLLPCGLVYGAAALAATGQSAEVGLLVMLAFGAGTLPAILGATLLSANVIRFFAIVPVRRAAGLLLLVSAAVQIAVLAIGSGAIAVEPEQRPCCSAKLSR